MEEEFVTMLFKVCHVLESGKVSIEKFNVMARKNRLNTKDLMLLFNVSERTLQRWRNTSKLKPVRYCGELTYLWPDVIKVFCSEI